MGRHRDAGYREGQRAALDGMGLPDGAYLAMEEEMGLDPFEGVDFDSPSAFQNDRYEPRVPRFDRYKIKANPKVQKPGDPIRQGDTMACPFCVKRVKVVGFGDHMLDQHRDKWERLDV